MFLPSGHTRNARIRVSSYLSERSVRSRAFGHLVPCTLISR